MSTIERAADQLLSRPRTQARVPEDKEQLELEPGAIERIAAESRAARVRTPARAEPHSRVLKVDRARLGERGFIMPDGGRTPVAESFRRIKREILANLAGQRAGASPANLVMVTSALAGEGKTYCAINLAISIALEVDRTVLLVDTDVAKADLPAVLGLQAERGLMDLLLDRSADMADVLWRTDIGRLSLLPVGAPHKHATELLASDAMRVLLRDMAQRYHDRIIIFDSPPLLAASEAGALASQMGQIVVVVESGRTSEASLKDALARVDAGRVAGLLLNKAPRPVIEYGYGAYG